MMPNTQSEMLSAPVLVKDHEVARMLDVSKRTVWRMVSAGQIPLPVRLGGNTRWRLLDIQNWIERGCPRDVGGKESDLKGG